MYSRKVLDWPRKNSSLPVKRKESLWLGFLINFICMFWFFSYLIEKKNTWISNLFWINYSSFNWSYAFIMMSLLICSLKIWKLGSVHLGVLLTEAWRRHFQYHFDWLLYSSLFEWNCQYYNYGNYILNIISLDSFFEESVFFPFFSTVQKIIPNNSNVLIPQPSSASLLQKIYTAEAEYSASTVKHTEIINDGQC